MSKDYFLNVILGIKYNDSNIFKIIKKGSDMGFIYYDYIWGKRYENSPQLTPEQAFDKVKQTNDIPNNSNKSLFLNFSNNLFSHMWFYTTDANLLKIDFAVFYKEKIYSDPEVEDESYVTNDFKYFIDIATSLGNEFCIQSLEAGYLDFYE